MNNLFKGLVNYTKCNSLKKTTFVNKPAFFISTKYERYLKEVNQENRELYTREQKKKMLQEDTSLQGNMRSVEREYDQESTNYFSRNMDDYFKTLNGNKSDLNDFSEDEQEDRLISLNIQGVKRNF